MRVSEEGRHLQADSWSRLLRIYLLLDQFAGFKEQNILYLSRAAQKQNREGRVQNTKNGMCLHSVKWGGLISTSKVQDNKRGKNLKQASQLDKRVGGDQIFTGLSLYCLPLPPPSPGRLHP